MAHKEAVSLDFVGSSRRGLSIGFVTFGTEFFNCVLSRDWVLPWRIAALALLIVNAITMGETFSMKGAALVAPSVPALDFAQALIFCSVEIRGYTTAPIAVY